MTTADVYARAVAYEHSLDRTNRYYRDLRQAELELFWTFVTNVRDRNERARLRAKFWRDQGAAA